MIIILVNWNNELKIIQQFLKEELVIEQIPLNLTQFQQKAEKERENNIQEDLFLKKFNELVNKVNFYLNY